MRFLLEDVMIEFVIFGWLGGWSNIVLDVCELNVWVVFVFKFLVEFIKLFIFFLIKEVGVYMWFFLLWMLIKCILFELK